MAWWGIAYANGPHINKPEMDAERSKAAWEAVQKAISLAPKVSEVERSMIGALGTRYSADASADRKPLDEAYAKAMAEVFAVGVEDFARAWTADTDARMTGALHDSLRRVCDGLGVVLPTADPALAQIVQRRVAMTRDHLLHPRADAEPTLTTLRMLGLPTGLISDCASDVPVVWHASPLAPLITTPLFSSSEGLKKPDTAIFERACARLGVTPHECLYVGDGASSELEGATAVGMRAVQLRAGDTDGAGWNGATIGSLSEALLLL